MSVIVSKELAKAKDDFRDTLVEAFVSSAIFGTSRETIRSKVGLAVDTLVQALLKQTLRAKKDHNEGPSTSPKS